MEPYIQISFLNDFIFCPRSIYFHQIYKNFDTSMYHENIQIKGRVAHNSIDQKKYSTSKHILQGLLVYSDTYSLCGRIDTFNTKTGELTERKRKIKKIYDGFIFQLYAQYYCLTEMGYTVNTLKLYSLIDNKAYSVALPKDNPLMSKEFDSLLLKIKKFDLKKEFSPNIEKCKQCIYKNLCDYGLSIC